MLEARDIVAIAQGPNWGYGRVITETADYTLREFGSRYELTIHVEDRTLSFGSLEAATDYINSYM